MDKDFDRETLHYQASVSKSLASTLAGIAVDQGLIGRVREPLCECFPEYADLRTGARAQITLEHLLSFTSGLAWTESGYPPEDPRNFHYSMFRAADPLRWLLERPLVTPTSWAR